MARNGCKNLAYILLGIVVFVLGTMLIGSTLNKVWIDSANSIYKNDKLVGLQLIMNRDIQLVTVDISDGNNPVDFKQEIVGRELKISFSPFEQGYCYLKIYKLEAVDGALLVHPGIGGATMDSTVKKFRAIPK